MTTSNDTRVTIADEFRKAADTVLALSKRATPGPWLATFTEPDGTRITDRAPGWDPDDDEDYDEGCMSLVAGTALPDSDGGLPGSYQSIHVLTESGDDLSREEAAELFASLRWAALLHPGCGTDLANLFIAAASDAEQVAADLDARLVPSVLAARWWQPVLAIARQVNDRHEAMGGERL